MKIKARLSVRPTKKGVAGEISWATDEGKSKKMSVPFGLPITLEMDGTECQVEMDASKIIRLEIEGRDLMAARSQTSSKTGGEIYDATMAKLPVDTAAVLARSPDIENFNLQLNNAAPFWEEEGPNKAKFAGYLRDRKGERIRFDPSFPEELIRSLLQRQEQSIITSGVPFAELEAKIDWRLVVGLGGASVYKTSMTLHHLYGIPYIPGSALKGVTRSCYIIEKYGQNNDSEEKALNDPTFRKIFGHPKLKEKEANKGFIVFHDAFPVPGSPPKIVPDVMNPHYGPYYSDGTGKIPPADYHNPVPVPFLTVQDATFRFYLSVHDRSGRLQADSEVKSVFDTAKEWLGKALSEYGIGAKTAVGYGYLGLQ